MNTVVNYAPGSNYPTPCGPHRRRGRVLLLAVISAIVAVTAARIEVLHWQAGRILPAQEFHPDGRLVKWRQSLLSNEHRWRELHGPRDPNGQPVTRPLTAAEQAEMTTSIRRARANNRLRDVVSTWGLAQYLLVPAALILAVPLLLDAPIQGRMRLLAAACACVAIVAGVLMFYRRYYLSLGW